LEARFRTAGREAKGTEGVGGHTHTWWLLGAGEEDLGAWCRAATVAQAGVATRERERDEGKKA